MEEEFFVRHIYIDGKRFIIVTTVTASHQQSQSLYSSLILLHNLHLQLYKSLQMKMYIKPPSGICSYSFFLFLRSTNVHVYFKRKLN